MRLTLHYRGRLKANGTPKDKLELRRHFHPQLKRLWQQEPLIECPAWLRDGTPETFLRPLGKFVFAPLVTKHMNAVAEISVVMLRPEPPGDILQSGDIDNRLKTLFDALGMPPQVNQLPPDEGPAADEVPFFCLLEDDCLVVRVSVQTEQLLEPDAEPGIVDASIFVETRITRPSMENYAFG